LVAGLYSGRDDGAAPAASDVLLFSAGSFVDGLLRTGKSAREPGLVRAQVVNNSWVAGFPTDAANADALRRLDYVINRDDVLVFNAVDNDGSKSVPKLLASSFNGVAVGTLASSSGLVAFDGSGARTKPDLVVDTDLTSNATALASGAGALLRSEAKARNVTAGAAAIKAILMAGARRDASWHRGRSSGADNRTASLDFTQGAGQVRVDKAFDILTAGEHAPGPALVPAAAGWDAARSPRRTSRATTYRFHVDQAVDNWSAVLTWNRVIEGVTDGTFSTAAAMPDFELSLYRQRAGGRRLVARSDSPNDNVETLTLHDLGPGTYQMVLTTDQRSRYALAWYAEADGVGSAARAASASASPAFETFAGDAFFATPAPEPSGVMLFAAPAAAMLGRRRRRAAGARFVAPVERPFRRA
jgi:hypothetical protein